MHWNSCGIVFAVLCAGFAFAQAPAPGTLTVKGDIATPLALKADDLAAMPREKFLIPNPDGTQAQYEGVALREILKRAGALGETQLRGSGLSTYVLASAHDGYQVLFTLGEIDALLGNAKIVIADRRDGKPLPDNQGPFRLVCPDDKVGARSVRMLESLEVVRLKK